MEPFSLESSCFFPVGAGTAVSGVGCIIDIGIILPIGPLPSIALRTRCHGQDDAADLIPIALIHGVAKSSRAERDLSRRGWRARARIDV